MVTQPRAAGLHLDFDSHDPRIYSWIVVLLFPMAFDFYWLGHVPEEQEIR